MGRRRVAVVTELCVFLIRLLNGTKVADLALPRLVVKDRADDPVAWPEEEGFDLKAAVANLARINENLQGAFLNLDISDDQHAELRKRYFRRDADRPLDASGEYREPLDFSNRTLGRIFSHRFVFCRRTILRGLVARRSVGPKEAYRDRRGHDC